MKLTGLLPAIVTPFSADGRTVDFASLEKLVDFVLSGGASGVVVCGSTGEAATLTENEYRTVIDQTRKFVGQRGLCIAGVGVSSTNRAVEMLEWISPFKLDGILAVTPPYNKPSQDGLIAHYAAMKAATDLPIIAYNVPGRTGVNLTADTVAKLLERELVVGLKESSGNFDQIMDIVRVCENKLALLSGEDSLVHAAMSVGAVGAISVTGNVLPAEIATMISAALKGDWSTSLKLQIQTLKFTRLMFSETNPIPVKAALKLRGVIAHSTVRLPLLPAKSATEQSLADELDKLGLRRQGSNLL